MIFSPKLREAVAKVETGYSGVLRPYNPVSWFHPKGILRVRARLRPLLPDVEGSLFMTFTVDPTLFASPEAAFESARKRLRKVFFALRKGASWNGVTYKINAAYCVKVEFHRNGWPHFHVVFLTRRFVPGELLSYLWELGRTDVRRISNARFRYLLKYVTKAATIPDWVLRLSRIRIWQTSPSFYRKPLVPKKDRPGRRGIFPRRRTPEVTTIGDRLTKWSRTATLERGKHRFQVALAVPFSELFNHFIYGIAVAGRYLGDRRIQIDDTYQLLEWINPRTKQTMP